MLEKLIHVLGVMVGMGILILILGSLSAFEKKEYIEITTRNPYSFSTELLLKCNWDGKQYGYLQTILIPKKSDIRIIVPANMRKCEIYPHVIF
jgi:hypothetical protein